jgi:hypothetical protein
MNALARAIGFVYFERNPARGWYGWELRFRWLDVAPAWGIGLSVANFGDEHGWNIHVTALAVSIYLRLPLPKREPKGEMLDKWGFDWKWGREWGWGDLFLDWGSRSKIVHMPWHPTWVRTSLLLADGTWIHETRMRREGFPNYPVVKGERRPFWTWHDVKRQFAWSETYPYRYVLRSGEVQDRQATVRVEEREWRPWCLLWLPLAGWRQRVIDISFDKEVGERSGSWKGGVMGCGFELRPQEMPREALARMERTQKL